MPKCMDKYKNNFAIAFAKMMQENSIQWKNLQKEHIKALYTKDVLWYILAFFGGFIPSKHETSYDLDFHIFLAIFLFISSIIVSIFIENDSFQKEIKSKLFPALLKVFGQDIVYGMGQISYSEYNKSMLFNKPVTHDSQDDVFCGIFNDSQFIISESSLTNVVPHKNGKSSEYQLFKGVAMRFKMQKRVKSRVLIYSKNLLNNAPKDFEKVEFEYEKFNKKYDVYVQKSNNSPNGQIEARYLFNTAFMDRFMQLQTSFKVNKIQCSIFGDSMLILLSTNKNLFELNNMFKSLDDISQYRKLFEEFASVLSFLEILNLSSKTGL